MTIPIITGGIGFLVALTIIFLIRRDQMQIGKATFWILAAVAFALLGLAPRLFDDLARYLGVDYAPSLAFMIALIVLAIKNLLDDIEMSRLKVRHRRTLQRVAVLQANQGDQRATLNDDQTAANNDEGPSIP